MVLKCNLPSEQCHQCRDNVAKFLLNRILVERHEKLSWVLVKVDGHIVETLFRLSLHSVSEPRPDS